MCVLSIRQLEKRIGNTTIFPQIDLSIHNGEAVAIQCNVEVSAHLIQILIGESSPSGGEILFLKEKYDSYKSLCKKVGIVLLNEGVYDRLTPFEYLTFYKRLYEADTDVNQLLNRIGLNKRGRIDKLSFSEKKRLQIGRAIIHNPDLLIIEEPIQNVDIESHYIIQNLISDFTDQGKAVLITTSNLENAIMMTNEVYILNSDGIKKLDVVDETVSQNEEEMNLLSVEEVSVSQDEEDVANEEIPMSSTPFRFEKIPAKVNDKIILLDPTEIDYIESNDGVSNLHVKGEIFPCTYPLNQLFDRLYPFGFFRCHRSYIVNLQKVREVITWTRNSYSLVLDDAKKSSVPLSKGKLNELKEIIGI
ncbi:LytTR family transcriptional regulator DNA-binding domain-containing protein [Heyndrickxia sp. NPDC080065]|uniref:LytTR family transcriptional regulator DNA-binding domain-containing protein n=1 Tax=Heyndrickxia sp. NPDC080065 TaxID=3390568 RepID=UPI003D016E7C